MPALLRRNAVATRLCERRESASRNLIYGALALGCTLLGCFFAAELLGGLGQGRVKKVKIPSPRASPRAIKDLADFG